MRFLRTNTAVIISVGPFYDKTDGVTPETGLTITNERITLVADTDDNSAPTLVLDNVTGATSGTSNDLNYITGQDNGMMQLELSAANTNRLGRMILTITDAANHVPVFHEFMVMPALVYDTFFASSGGATFPAATLASTTNITAGTITTATNVTTVNGLAANVITAAATAADFGTEVAAAVWDMDATGHQTQGSFGQVVGDSGADTDSIWSLANTNLDATISSRASQTSVNTIDDFLDTEIASIQADTDDIQARLPAALTAGGNMKSDMLALNGGTQSAADLKDFADDGYDPATNKVQGVVLTDTVTTYTGNTPQTGDTFARIGANGAGLTAIDLPDQTMNITGNITGNLSGSVGSVTGSVNSVTSVVEANVKQVNDIDVTGSGTTLDPWGPA